MSIVSITIPAHTHLHKNGFTSDVPKSAPIRISRNRIYTEITSSRLEKILSCIPIIGLFVASYLLYQKITISKAFTKLGYIPNKSCSNFMCLKLDPDHLNFIIGIAVFGGTGLLFPLYGLVACILLIMVLVSKIISSCRDPYPYP
ncbi:hypothetical protein O1W69_03835 [Chlamydia sp. 12-01]|uniref:hypothetical protein n=1 Tax=Chlamydia sp. 12-01 TaxID=3002742 RepID=UPI0035D44187